MSAVCFRLPQLDDLAIIQKWHAQQMQQDPDPFFNLSATCSQWPGLAESSSRQGHRGALIIESQRTCIGMLFWTTDESTTARTLDTEISLFFAPEFRSMGYGQAVLKHHLQDIIQHLPESSVFAEIDQRNTAAIKMIENTNWMCQPCKDPSWLRIVPRP